MINIIIVTEKNQLTNVDIIGFFLIVLNGCEQNISMLYNKSFIFNLEYKLL